MECVKPLQRNHCFHTQKKGYSPTFWQRGNNKNDIYIFSLAVLLSSVLVYNSMGTIDQDAIDKLKFVGELSSMIKVKSQGNDDEEAEFSSHFPMFIWAVRDFHLGLMIDGKAVTEDEYLENALKLKKPEKTIRDQDYNRVRQQLRMYFGKRKCFVFDLPTANEQHLKRLEDIPDDDLNADFVTQSQKFCDYIFKEADVKRMKGTFPVTGPRLGELAKIYTEAINSSKVACMEEAVASLAEGENKMSVQEATQHYEDKMNKVVFPTETLSQFLDISRQYEDQARKIFLTRCFQDDDQRYLKEFLETTNKKKKEFSFKNETKSQEICGALIRNLSVDLEKALSEGAYNKPGGHGKFKQDLKFIEVKYNNETGKGLKAEEVLQEYLKSKEGNSAIILQQDNALSQREKEEEEERSRKEIKEREEKMQQVEEARRAQKAEEEMANIKETARQLMDKFNEEKKIMSEKINQAIEEKSKEYDLYMKQAQEAQAKMFKEQIVNLERRLQEKNNSPFDWISDLVKWATKIFRF